jgi:hypothetical protein
MTTDAQRAAILEAIRPLEGRGGATFTEIEDRTDTPSGAELRDALRELDHALLIRSGPRGWVLGVKADHPAGRDAILEAMGGA